jgi:sulfur dioxygenase
MIFHQLFDPVSSTYTYLLASRRGGEALIVDPVLEQVDSYLALTEQLDLRLVKAVDTHVHADHVTGLGKLRDLTRCITVMGEQSGVDVVSMRVREGDTIDIEGVSLSAIYTPGHTDDSYSFYMKGRVFTGDTLLIRGTGRTDFQNGDPEAQYDSLFNKLLRLPDMSLVYPAHDYKGETVTTIGEERLLNPRLQVQSRDEYVDLMNNLKLDNPKMMDVAIPANLSIGMHQSRGLDTSEVWTAESVRRALERSAPDLVPIDLREEEERRREGVVPRSIHAPYPNLEAFIRPESPLHLPVFASGSPILFYCSYGERSALAVLTAKQMGVRNVCHLQGGIRAWKEAAGELEMEETRAPK